MLLPLSVCFPVLPFPLLPSSFVLSCFSLKPAKIDFGGSTEKDFSYKVFFMNVTIQWI